MLANYGYEDGTGTYYIKIDTSNCSKCSHKNCVKACVAKILLIDKDDWGDEIISIPDQFRNNLMTLCMTCKSKEVRIVGNPCQEACDMGSINHTW